MATNSPSEINGSDPTVLRQIERQNTALQTRGVSAPPSVSGTSGANTTTTAGAVRNLAPIVSGSETLYPQSTTATSSSAVTINSSINNDTGDVTTVYTTNGRITVNPINQTINQYTSVDSGVSQIVAGNGVTISSTGSSGTGVVTINASTVALGNIVSVNLDGNSANVLHGDGSWSADQTTYGNSNVAAYLPTYTGNIGGNVVTANLFAGSGASLSAIAGANVSGFVPNANVANTAFAVAAANVSGLGNVALVNFDGNSSNVLYGNGVFDSVGSPFNQDLNTTDNVTFANITSTDAIRLSNSSNIVGALGYAPTYVSIEGYGSNAVNITANDVYTWTFGDTGNLTLPGNTFSVNYANGVQVSIGGGGNVSELINGNNLFVLDSAGNVVFEGTPSGNAVDRGLVWDYGANANGVNSMIRQDINGLTVRAWTENAGNYTAPVNIITGQDANTNTWRFDGQGNLTVPSGSIKSINDGGQLGAYVTLTPDLGLARLAGRSSEYTENFNSGGWTSASYTGTQVDIIDAPNLLGFVSNNTIFTSAVDRTFSINGGEPVPYTGYGASGNNVTLYTDITADPDPTVVTSIDFYYQSESFVAIDYDDGTLNINATGLTINLDNDQTSGPDINLRSGDDILLQAKNKALGSESEGGDINIYAGDGASDDGQGNTASTGGDIQITAGNGGDGNSSSGSGGGFTTISGGTGGSAGVTNTAGSGGYVSIEGGDGGNDGGNTSLGGVGGNVSITAGLTTQEGVNGSNVVISSGQAGPNALAGNVEIFTPASANGFGGTWRFDGNGKLTFPGTPRIDTYTNNFEVQAAENINFEANAVVNIYTDTGNAAYQWQFGDDGNLTLPGNTFAVNYANGTPVTLGGGSNTGNVTFDNVTVQGVNGLNLSAGSDFTANLAYLQVRAGDVASHIHLDTGNNSAYDLIVGDDQNYVQVSSTGNILLSSYDSNTAQYTWTLDYNGNLILAGGNSVIQSIANSSLDPTLPNVSTMVLTPDANYNSQVLVLDPTAPGHIHLRAFAFSNIDEPAANIFLGGENTAFEITQGANNDARIHSGSNTWTFGNDGDLTVPGNLVYIGASPAPSISGFNSVSAEEFTNDTSNVTINANSNQWVFDTTGNLIIPGTSGGVIKTVANGAIAIAAVDNGSDNPAQLLSINANGTATTALSAYATQATIQANINGDIKTWAFNNAGNLILPGNTVAINFANGTAAFGNVSGINLDGNTSNVLYGNGVFAAAPGGGSYGDSNVTTLLGSFGSNAISTTGNISGGNVLASGTSSTVVRRAFGLVAYDTTVTLDDLSASVPSTGGDANKLFLQTSGGWQGTGWTENIGSGSMTVNNWINLPLSSGFATSTAITSQGQGCRTVISDQTPNAKMYQITVMKAGTTGSQWNISIERLV